MHSGSVGFILPSLHVDPRPSPTQDDSSVGQQQNKSLFAKEVCATNIGVYKIHEEIKTFCSEAIRLANELPEGHKSQSLLECDKIFLLKQHILKKVQMYKIAFFRKGHVNTLIIFVREPF